MAKIYSGDVNRQSKIPLQQQIYEILRGKISRKEWNVGDMIPSEPELMEIYGVSRMTIRQVLDRLVSEGLIYRQQGKGSFIAEMTLEQGLVRIISFTEDMHQRGLIPGTRIIFAGIIPAPGEIAEKLQINEGEELVRLERLRLANDEPMSIEESYLVHRYCPGVLAQDFSKVPLRDSLETNFGIRLVRANQVIRAVMADKKIARYLSIPLKTALLNIERISFSQRDVPVEFLKIYYRGDRYSLYNELIG